VLGLAARSPFIVEVALCVLAGAGTTLSNALNETVIQHHVQPGALSRISAIQMFASLASQPIGQIGAGPLAASIGVFPALWVAGSAQLLSAIGRLAVPAIRRLQAWPEDACPSQPADQQ
jgi:hypothetical protein